MVGTLDVLADKCLQMGMGTMDAHKQVKQFSQITSHTGMFWRLLLKLLQNT